MKCEHCGAELKDNVKFCENCGAPVELEEEDDFEEEAPRKKGIFDGVQVSTHLEVGGVLGAILKAKKKKDREKNNR